METVVAIDPPADGAIWPTILSCVCDYSRDHYWGLVENKNINVHEEYNPTAEASVVVFTTVFSSTSSLLSIEDFIVYFSLNMLLI